MNRYIDADDIKKFAEHLKNACVPNSKPYEMYASLARMIDRTPTADVEPVRHGYWLLLDECANSGVYCSHCHKKVYKEQYANQKIKSKYCPNCGAKMDKETE